MQPEFNPQPEPQPQSQPQPQPDNTPFQTPETPTPPQKSPKTKILVILLAVIVVLAIGSGITWFVMSKVSTSETTQQATAPAKVTITKDGFTPASIKVKKDQAVEWINDDGTPHSIASDPHPSHDQLPGLDSIDPLNTGESYLFTFETTGTYTYHDDVNPDKFKGTVIVE